MRSILGRILIAKNHLEYAIPPFVPLGVWEDVNIRIALLSGFKGRSDGCFGAWETINEGSYSGIIIPVVDEILEQYPDLQFQTVDTQTIPW